MLVNRELLLNQLEVVSPGLSVREIVEQSSCFSFDAGKVFTYNDEVACYYDCCIEDISGAVPAKPLLSLLRRMNETEIDVTSKDVVFRVKGKSAREADFRMDMEINYPLDSMKKPKNWKKLPKKFGEAVKIVEQCASTNVSENKGILTYVHIHPNWIEATDNVQITRYHIETPLKIPIGVRKDSIKHIVNMDMSEFGETREWVHFRAKSGLVLACRRWAGIEYPELDEFVQKKGRRTQLPKGLFEAVERAEIFSEENPEENLVEISIIRDRLTIKGEGAFGSFREKKKIKYNGPDIVFVIAPKLMGEISKRFRECRITDQYMKVEQDGFVYVTCLGVPKTPETDTEEDEGK